ncbi:MAG: hypothetical protein KDB23_24600, partial [Planctomycetales bacterium]|nr:hypothetical protein [Planctomycetales bacterium]
MPICPSCRAGYEDSESTCPQCGEPKPHRHIRSSGSLDLPSEKQALWSVDGLPYKLFAFAALAHYVLAFSALASGIVTSLVAFGFLSLDSYSARVVGIPALL